MSVDFNLKAAISNNVFVHAWNNQRVKSIQIWKYNVCDVACVAFVFNSYGACKCNHTLNIWILFYILMAAVRIEILNFLLNHVHNYMN
jgi:hypothetical protein